MPCRLAPAAIAIAVLASAALSARVVRADGGAPVAVSWATVQAIDRTRAGQIHARCNELDSAQRAFLDAISFDATYGPAYLGLDEVLEERGDMREAERTLSMGIEHVAGFYEGLVARGRLRARVHRTTDAIADLEAAAALHPDAGVLRALTDAYIAARALPAALAATRLRLALAEAQGDARDAGEARALARALVGLVGEVDPVTAGGSGRGLVRRALWAATRRR